MILQDRPYQQDAVAAIWQYFRENNGNPVVAMPQGTGKSVVISRFLQSVFKRYPASRVMMLTHVKELIVQNYHKLSLMWPNAPAGIYSASVGRKEIGRPIIFGGIGSVCKKPELFGKIDLLIIDECHLIGPADTSMYRQFIAALAQVNPHLKVIGFTATPWRLGQGYITETFVNKAGVEIKPMFDDVCFDLTATDRYNAMVRDGYLSKLVAKGTKTQLDVSEVQIRGGEFVASDLERAVNKDEVTFEAVQEAMLHGVDRHRWLVFASGIDHAESICEMLNHMGIDAGCVHSKRGDRDETLKKFSNGELRAVVNNNVLTTGYDEPGIDMIVGLRPTCSSVLWGQMLGRGTRPLYSPGFDLSTVEGRFAAILNGPKQDCLVLDYARNTRSLGPINNPRVPRPKGSGGEPFPEKECPECGTFHHPSVRVCDSYGVDGKPCNHKFEFKTKIEVSASSDEPVKDDLPIVEVFRVDNIVYSRHTKIGSHPTMKVSYYCNLQKFDEYICFEHPRTGANWAWKRALNWWKVRSSADAPATVFDALEEVADMPAPTHLRVWTNKPWPEILAVCFDGSAFGTRNEALSQPEVTVSGRVAKRPEQALSDEDLAAIDDFDIPF